MKVGFIGLGFMGRHMARNAICLRLRLHPLPTRQAVRKQQSRGVMSFPKRQVKPHPQAKSSMKSRGLTA